MILALDGQEKEHRAPGLKVPPVPRLRPGEPVHLVVDSTGLKVFGEGEWKIKVHDKDKRRIWRKLHLGVDAGSNEILAHELTANGCHDAPKGRHEPDRDQRQGDGYRSRQPQAPAPKSRSRVRRRP